MKAAVMIAWRTSMAGVRAVNCAPMCPDKRAGRARERRSVVATWQPVAAKPVAAKPELMAALSFDGTCHSRLFELWLRVMLCPLLRAGQVVILDVVILDNARFHRPKAVQRILRRVGCRVGCRALFLPAYSPNLNPIEAQWHSLKNRVRTNRVAGMEFKLALETALL